MALVLLLKRQWALLVLGIVLAGGGKFLESTLKTMVERPRPVYADAELAARSYSFPSGNTLLALILYGFLIYLILPFMQTKQTRTMLISLGIVWIVLIAISRVVLGDHYPGDVLGSLALGGAWLGFGIGISERYHFLLDNR
jgi:undecaprenyl-diphosphatase